MELMTVYLMFLQILGMLIVENHMTHLQGLLSLPGFPHLRGCLLEVGVRPRDLLPSDETLDEVQHFLCKCL